MGSRNPAKVDPVRDVAAALFPGAAVTGVGVDSGVSAQPASDEEAIAGAISRAEAALALAGAGAGSAEGAADLAGLRGQSTVFGVGIEAGVASVGGRLFGCTWAAVVSGDGTIGLGSSARFQVPPVVAEGIARGEEMGEVMARVFGDARIREREGAMGVVSSGHVTRRSATVQAVSFAFAPFVSPHLYPGE